MFIQLVLNFISALTQCHIVLHVRNLTTYMKMQSFKRHMGQLIHHLYNRHHIRQRNAKLILSHARDDMRVCMCFHIGINA